MWKGKEYDVAANPSSDHKVKITPLANRKETIQGDDYEVCGFEISFHRQTNGIGLEAYFPCGLFVAITWASYLLIAPPARITLLVVSLLMQTNLYNAQKKLEPPSTFTNALDYHFVTCMSMVLFVFLEYGFILCIEN